MYTYTDNNNCTVSDSVDIEIIGPTQADAGSDDAICEDSVLYTLVGYSPVGYMDGSRYSLGYQYI